MPAIPMEVSLPLALHLRSPVTYNFLTGQTWKPGEKYQESRTISEVAFIHQNSERSSAQLLFASIIRTIYNHPDWSELHGFFTKRYPGTEALSEPLDREARQLTGAKDDAAHPAAGNKRTIIANFKTDPSSVGLPRDLRDQLAEACRLARGALLGPDPQPCSIGPAISVATGPGTYMELTYMGQPPGKYPERRLIDGEWYGWGEDGKHGVLVGAIATTKKGGRGRSWGEWAELWRVVADWVYEYDATSVQHFLLNKYSYRCPPSDEEREEMGFGRRVPRESLSTGAIDAADAVRDVFAQLDADPLKFQGIEWDYLEFELEPHDKELFYARFGQRDAVHERTLEELGRSAALHHWDQWDYEDVSPAALKPCPDTFRGADWEAWLLSIEGGDVAVARTPFQALWAVMLLAQLPLVIKIVSKDGKFPKYRDPDNVYL